MCLESLHLFFFAFSFRYNKLLHPECISNIDEVSQKVKMRRKYFLLHYFYQIGEELSESKGDSILSHYCLGGGGDKKVS